MDVGRLGWERGELFGLLEVRCDIVGARAVEGCISVGTFNLTSVSARTSRAKELKDAALAPEIDFRLYLEELCQRTIRTEQEGHPVILLSNVVTTTEPEAVKFVHGIPLLLKHPTIWYGHGGTGKSTLALAAAGELERQDVSVLYLDWETNETTNHAILSLSLRIRSPRRQVPTLRTPTLRRGRQHRAAGDRVCDRLRDLRLRRIRQ